MKTLLTILLILCASAAGHAQDAEPAREKPAEKEEEIKIPSTLAEVHEELERLLPKEELAKIDAMESEDEMIEFHFGAGMGMRNSWGLWGDSRLAKHMRDLGFTHADDISAVILDTFWCKRHQKDLRIEERVAYYKAYWQEQKDPDIEFAPEGKGKIRWIWKLEVPSRLHGVLHVGMDLKSRRFVCFEHTTGIYYPEGSVLERVYTEIVQNPEMAGYQFGQGLREVKRGLSGVYKIASTEGERGPLHGPRIGDYTVIISEDLITTYDSERNRVFEAVYQLDTIQHPMAITLTASLTPDLGRHGIELTGNIQKTGDTIRLIYALPGGDDPRDFEVGPKQELLVLSKTSEMPVEDGLQQTKQGEQAGTGQPATRPESKSEGDDQPQPEAEGRSR
jgi:hypothetical protein